MQRTWASTQMPALMWSPATAGERLGHTIHFSGAFVVFLPHVSDVCTSATRVLVLQAHVYAALREASPLQLHLCSAHCSIQAAWNHAGPFQTLWRPSMCAYQVRLQVLQGSGRVPAGAETGWAGHDVR